MAQVGTGPMDPDSNSLIPSSQSIRSETSFDLFENQWDFMLMPGYLGLFEDDGRVYTQLANLGGMDMLQFGFYKPMGPGYLAMKLQYSTYEDEVSFAGADEDYDVDFGATLPNIISDPNVTTGTASVGEDFDAGDIYIAYAWPLSEDSSLGFAIDYAWDNAEFDQSFNSVDTPRDGTTNSEYFPPIGTSVNYETLSLTQSGYDKYEMENVTLIGEYMKRGDISWRIRGAVQSVDNKIESSYADVEDWNLPDDDILDDYVGGIPFDFKTIDVNDSGYASGTGSFGSSSMSLLRGVNGDGPSIGGSPFFCIDGYGCGPEVSIDSVGHDGTRFGLEGDVRFEKNPKLQHQANLGFYSSSLDPKEDTLFGFQEMITVTATEIVPDPTDPFGEPGTQVEDYNGLYELTENAVITGNDITRDDFFLTWKTRWHLGDTHIGVGGYLFFNEMNTEVSGTANRVETFYVANEGGILGGFTVTSLAEYSLAHNYERMTFSIPIALEQDIGKRLTLRLGTQWLYEDVTHEWDFGATELNDIFENLDPDDPDPISTDVNLQVTNESTSDEWTDSGVFYHAGLAYEFDRVTLEVMFSDTILFDEDRYSYSSTNREPVDFNEIFIGATIKLGGS